MREYDRTTDSSSQSDVILWMEKYPNTWFTTKQIRDALKLKSREKIAKFLRKLYKFKFVEMKRISGTNEKYYKFVSPKSLEKINDGATN